MVIPLMLERVYKAILSHIITKRYHLQQRSHSRIWVISAHLSFGKIFSLISEQKSITILINKPQILAICVLVIKIIQPMLCKCTLAKTLLSSPTLIWEIWSHPLSHGSVKDIRKEQKWDCFKCCTNSKQTMVPVCFLKVKSMYMVLYKLTQRVMI